jgi:hypothetical protein
VSGLAFVQRLVLCFLLPSMRSPEAASRAFAPIRVLTTLSLLGGASGCSYVLAAGPPPHPESASELDCSSTRLLPSLDMVLGGVFASATIGAVIDDSGDSANSGVVTAGIAAVSLASAVYGFTVTERCIEAKRAHDLAMAKSHAPAIFAPARPGLPGPAPDLWLSAGPPPPPIPGSAPPPPPDVPPPPEAPDGGAP